MRLCASALAAYCAFRRIQVIVSSRYWMDHLPHIIEAFIPGFMATNLRNAYLKEYPEVFPEDVPLWHWDPM